jgi:AbrB family looped-hinge helix DNA binding protein
MNELSPRRYSADPSTLKVGPQGRLVIPANLRRSLNLQAGIELVARAEDGQLVLETLDNLRRRLRERYQGTRSTSMADELIAERRQEALRELERENPS